MGAAAQRVPLPHRDRLERAFGEPLGDVQVQTGAGEAMEALGAHAATVGNTIAFAADSPDLRTTAHEVAHVLQNRHAEHRGPTGPAEADAHQAAASAVAGAPAGVSAAPGGELQLLSNPVGSLLRRLRGKRGGTAPAPAPAPVAGTTARWGMTDADLASTPVRGNLTSTNRVDRVTYKKFIGTSGEKQGFFKPTTDDVDAQYTPANGDMAIATTRLDAMMGFGMLPAEYAAEHGGERGTVSPKVAGKATLETIYDKEMHPDKFDADTDTEEGYATYLVDWAAENADSRAADGRYLAMSGLRQLHHDYTNPVTQRGLADLQLFDAITGQYDRHGGNIFIDDASGNVRGIDNDKALAPGDTDVSVINEKYLGLPLLVSAGTARRVLAFDVSTLPAELDRQMRHAGAGHLTPEQFALLQNRLTQVQTYVKGLAGTDRLIDDGSWGPTTYQRTMAQPDVKTWTGMKPTSYLKREKVAYDNAVASGDATSFEPAPAPPVVRRKRNFGPLPTRVTPRTGVPLPPTPSKRTVINF